MEKVVVGVDDETTARPAVLWVIDRARRGVLHLHLVAELDDGGSNPGSAKQKLATAARDIEAAAPGTVIEFVLADRPLLHELLDRGDTADLLVVGSHPDDRVRDARTSSLPISLAARANCPVVIVPDDWHAQSGPVVVGVDDADDGWPAVAFAAREALAAQRELRVVHTWESWKTLDARAEHIEHGEVVRSTAERVHVEFPAVQLAVVLEEAVAHDGVIANSRDAGLIVLGSHGIGRETGLVLGAIHQEVMISGRVPLAVVPVGT